MQPRKTTRYQLTSPATYWWGPKGGQRIANRGVTRDISTAGVFIFAQEQPPVGARIELEILLPSLENIGPGVRLYGEGLVLRVERENHNNTGFAASVEFAPETCDDETTPKLQTQYVELNNRQSGD